MVHISPDAPPPAPSKPTRADDCTLSGYNHTPVAPFVPPDHPKQRYYSRTGVNDQLPITPPGSLRPKNPGKTEVRVFRFAYEDLARFEISIRSGDNTSRVEFACNPAQLRAISDRLLDAASDLEISPSVKLEAANHCTAEVPQ